MDGVYNGFGELSQIADPAQNLVELSRDKRGQITANAYFESLRASLGIQERRLGHIIDDLKAEDINISAAKSRIFDADMASEITDFTRLQILQQSGTAILAQANAQPQNILQLLQ